MATKTEKMTKNLNGHFVRSTQLIETLRALGYTVEIVKEYPFEAPTATTCGCVGGYWVKANVNGNRLWALTKAAEAARI